MKRSGPEKITPPPKLPKTPPVGIAAKISVTSSLDTVPPPVRDHATAQPPDGVQAVSQPPVVDVAAAPQEERRQTVMEAHGYAMGVVIGSGSYAEVKKAYSQKHQSTVAVKIVSKMQAPDDYLKRFLPREIEVVKGLRHPNLIKFLQAIETTHRVYIVMEYSDNGSLLDVIRRDLQIDEVRARKWFRQMVEAVGYCHSQEVVHRDIKCENMLMDAGYNIKLSDFGFARNHSINSRGMPDLCETYCGSYAYASPEILRGTPYNPRMSDVWSTGVVLFAMVYGRLPFDDSSYSRLVRQVERRVAFPREPRVSSECKNLITRILAQLRTRIILTEILADVWLHRHEPVHNPVKAESSDSLDPDSRDPSRQRVGSALRDAGKSNPEDAGVVRLTTKQSLRDAASQPDPRRRSTLEEEETRNIQAQLDQDRKKSAH